MAQIDLQPLIDQLFKPQASAVPSARPDDWQQDLMQSVDPDVQKKERIRNLLATVGNTLSTTPGNFLQGLAAGAGKGATLYNQQRTDDKEKRIAAQRLIHDFNQKQMDRQTGQVTDKLNIARTLNKDEQADEDRIYNRDRQQKLDDLSVRRVDIAERRAESDAKRIEARLPKNGNGPLTEWQQQQTLTAIDNLVAKFQTSLGDPLDEDEEKANIDAVEAYRRSLYKRRNFDPDSGAYLGKSAEAPQPGILPQAPAEGKTSIPLKAPPPVNQRVVGQTYESPNGPVIWMGTGWKKAQ